MSNIKGKPIGVFDSGLGGLTAVKELSKILPKENIVYFGDIGRVPYGSKSRETIIKYALQDVSFLMSLGVKIIIVACGTVSSVAMDINSSLGVPFIGVVKPTCISAAKITKNGKIGVIGTTATINSNSYKNEIKKINSDIEIFSKDCPLFVPLVENGFISKDDPILKLTVERYLEDLTKNNIDTLILGCTHYPIIKDAICDYLGSKVSIVDAGKEVALYSSKILKNKNIDSDNLKNGNISFYVSDSTEEFSKTARVFLGKSVSKNISRVYIENYGL